MPDSARRLTKQLLSLGAGCLTALTVTTAPVAAAPAAAVSPAAVLDLGPMDLPEVRTTRTVQPGVTVTQIQRGEPDRTLSWTLEVAVPATSTSPDPDAPPRSLGDRASADAAAARLSAAGYSPRVEQVDGPRASDVSPGVVGYRVRVGAYLSRAEADVARTGLLTTGLTASAVFTGWDGEADDRGPWALDVLVVNPRSFRGSFVASYGPDIERRETPTQLAALAGATAGVNGGYFVLDPASGAPGDPAGAGVYGGRLLSEPVAGRPVLQLRSDGRASVQRLTWQGTAVIGGEVLVLDGVDRVPGLVRNCGGDPTDAPTALPLHDVTCTDESELVAFTPEFGASTPTGAGIELVLDAKARIVDIQQDRGTVLAAGTTSLQATGSLVRLLTGAQLGDRVRVRTHLVGEHGRATRPGISVVNGGPLLVRNGTEQITLAADGFVRPKDPSFTYGFVVKRNPRTLAGVDARGRTVLVTADGRSTSSLGLSIAEAADVARSLGLVDALNLDGGGSTAMVVGGRLVTTPSDATGERPVGDALLVLPSRR